MKTKALLSIVFSILMQGVEAQNVAINSTGTAPNASAGLDVNFSDKGLLIPRIALSSVTDQSTISSPTTSLLVYNTGDGALSAAGYYYWTGSAWTKLANGNASVAGWGTTGNNDIVSSTNWIGTTNANDVVFKSNNTERLRLASGGNVSFSGLATGSSTDYLMSINNTSNVIRKIQPSSASSPFWTIGGNAVSTSAKSLGTTTAFDLPFITNNLERMRILSDGKVGIGSTSFDVTYPEKLLVDGGTTTNNVINAIGNVNDYIQIGIQNKSSGLNASSDIVASSTNTDYYVDMGINSSGYISNRSNILYQPYTAYLYSSSPEYFFIGNGAVNKGLIFFTNGGNSANANNSADGTERMVITSKGIVGIGYNTTQSSSPNTPTNDQYLLSVNSKVLATAFDNPSDRRLKTNIQGLNYGLKDVLALQPVSYNWIDPSQTKETQLGLIAQDVRKVIPEIVSGNEEKEKLSINYTELIPVLINALKEQQEQINQQKKAIDEIQKKLQTSISMMEGK